MPVVTIPGQVGSGDEYLGKRVAKALDHKFVNREVFEQVLKRYGIVRFEELLDSAPHFMGRFDRVIWTITPPWF